MLIAVPVSFGIALFLTEVAPPWLRTPVASAIELLAGIPSIIYGMWGLFVFVPVMSTTVIPFLTEYLGPLVFLTVPTRLKESAYALGSTTWEVAWNVVLPYTRSAVIGGVFLGLGRALGETMAVTFVLGNAHHLTASLLMPGNSIAATIANEFSEADSDIYLSSLIALGFLLFIVTFVVLAIAKLMLMRLNRNEGHK
jgi:phosphate transport system permease protein